MRSPLVRWTRVVWTIEPGLVLTWFSSAATGAARRPPAGWRQVVFATSLARAAEKFRLAWDAPAGCIRRPSAAAAQGPSRACARL